jgi:hypothetical protein
VIPIVGGVLALIALETLVSQSGSQNFGGTLNFFAGAVRWLVDPSVPGIPNTAHDPGSPQTASAASYSSAGPTAIALTAQQSAAAQSSAAQSSAPPAQASLLPIAPAGAQPTLV